MSPEVSVIIPNYNHARYLRQRIESVLNQTYRNFEIILLDDHSSDNSREIINDYASNPFVSKLILNDKNSGTPFKQWQRGIGAAAGKWIWIAESDDYADPAFLEVMIAAAEKHPTAGLVYCDSKIIDKNEITDDTFASLKNKRQRTSRWSNDHYNQGLDEIENYLLPYGTINNTSAVLFKKKILEEVNPFDITFRYIGDKYAFLKVLSMSDIVYVSQSLNYYRDAFTTRHFDKFLYYFYEHFLVFDWVYRNLKISEKKFLSAFYFNTQNSLFRDWNRTKLYMYKNLFRINSRLLLRAIAHNFLRSVNSLFSRARVYNNSLKDH